SARATIGTANLREDRHRCSPSGETPGRCGDRLALVLRWNSPRLQPCFAPRDSTTRRLGEYSVLRLSKSLKDPVSHRPVEALEPTCLPRRQPCAAPPQSDTAPTGQPSQTTPRGSEGNSWRRAPGSVAPFLVIAERRSRTTCIEAYNNAATGLPRRFQSCHGIATPITAARRKERIGGRPRNWRHTIEIASKISD